MDRMPPSRSTGAGIIGHICALSPTFAAKFGAIQDGKVFSLLASVLSGAEQPPQQGGAAGEKSTDIQWAVYALGTLLLETPANVTAMLATRHLLKRLVLLLREPWGETIQRLSCVALHYLLDQNLEPVQQQEVAEVFVAENVMAALAELLLSTAPILVQAAVVVLGSVAQLLGSSKLLASFQSSHVFPRLLALFHTTNRALAFLSIQAVSSCLLSSQNACRLLSTQHPELITELVKLLDVGCPNTQCVVCGMLCSLAAVRFECSLAIRREGGIEKLVALLASPSIKVQSRALGALGSCAANCGLNKKHIRELGAIPVLVSFLKSPHTELHIIAAAAISNCLADSPATQALVLRYGGIAALIDNLSSPSPELRNWSVRGLFNASKDNVEISIEIGRLGGPALLCQHLLRQRNAHEIHQTLCG